MSDGLLLSSQRAWPSPSERLRLWSEGRTRAVGGDFAASDGADTGRDDDSRGGADESLTSARGAQTRGVVGPDPPSGVPAAPPPGGRSRKPARHGNLGQDG